ncbi:PadR family transcriptional regulator [Pedomonas mirosovicensis]|uniref:PadR family transcriptional regulator n=1 Tax=Pedomonas mirosovicensis TaxID=2908641 RepID=UPI0021694899|nr:PadR family transcriptional regulator [Pedomonas mirosovicensis]MCH8684499.1 PadR family transcriptional regulator [Pedomonas mirosovicensis]
MHPFHHFRRFAFGHPHGGRHGGGPFGGHEGGPGGRHGGGRRRVFNANELRLILLKLIEDQPRHGYDLIREIETRSSGAYAPSPGVVYPAMSLMIDMGLARGQETDDARRQLAITDAGRAFLAEHAEDVAALQSRLQALAEVGQRTDSGPVRRAMHNLKAVLQDRLSQPDVDREKLLKAAALIDEAASQIERL